MKKLSVELDGEMHEVWAEKIRGQLWFHWNGKTYVYEPEQRSRRGGGKARANPGEVQAPMPGKVIKVLVNQKQVVEKRAPVVVMEAMKMEYTLEAEVDGHVLEVNCRPGDSVASGQTVVRIEPAKAES